MTNYSVRPSQLDKIQNYLICGERKRAVQYALDHKLWAHAIIIASSIDQENFKSTVLDFVRSELNSASPSESSNGREGLRVLYSLFAGSGAAASTRILLYRAVSSTGVSDWIAS